VSPPASDRMRSELFTLINLSNWPVSEFGEKAGTFLLSGRASGRLQEIFGKCVEHLWKLGRVARQFLRSGAPRT